MISNIVKYTAITVSASLLASCGQPQILGVDDATINLAAVEGAPSAGYFTIRGGPENVSLVSVESTGADNIELHETVEEDGVSKMKMLSEVEVPAQQNVEFEKGGKHLMVFGIKSGVVKKGVLNLTVEFSNGEKFKIPAEIRDANGEPVAAE